MTSKTIPRDDEFEVQIGRADKGTFVRVIHLPSGISRAQVGIQGESYDDIKLKFKEQIIQEFLQSTDSSLGKR